MSPAFPCRGRPAVLLLLSLLAVQAALCAARTHPQAHPARAADGGAAPLAQEPGVRREQRQNAPGCAPTQVHLALGQDHSEMHVSWKTEAANCASEVLFSRLDPAAGGDGGWQQQQQQQPLRAGAGGVANAVGYSFLLSERDMCSAPAASNTFLLYLHRAKVTGLEPNTTYAYQVAGAAAPRRFTSAPAPGPEAPVTFLAFGDMGDARHAAAKSPGAWHTLARLREEAAAAAAGAPRAAGLVLHVGDLSYGDGAPEVWDSFMDDLEPVASTVPYMVAVGNHEYGYRRGEGGAIDPSGASEPFQPAWGNFGADSRGECGVMAARRFHMPRRGRRRGQRAAGAEGPAGGAAGNRGNPDDVPDNRGNPDDVPDNRGNPDDVPDNPPFWYGLDYGSVHFAVISTEHDLDPGSPQYRWLEEELAGVDRCVTPWLVVMLHRPLYVVYPHKSNRQVGEHLRRSIEPLLLSHRVDLTVAGHVHSYYRTCPVRGGECTDEQGEGEERGRGRGLGGGCGDGGQCGQHEREGEGEGRHSIVHFVIGSAGRKLSAVELSQEEWVAATRQRWGYGRFTVLDGRRLLAEFVGSERGEVLDSVVVAASREREAACGGGGGGGGAAAAAAPAAPPAS